MNLSRVLEIAIEVLLSQNVYAVIPPSFYRNKRSIPGIYACFEMSGGYLILSISNCWMPLGADCETASILANLIKGIKTVDQFKTGTYYNRQLIPGLYLTARSTVPLHSTCDHWFMLGIPNVEDEGFSLFKQHILRARINRHKDSSIAEFFE